MANYPGIILIIACLFFGSCQSYRHARPPEVKHINNFKYGSIQNGKMQFSFTTELYNPDRLRFRVRSAELDLMVNGVRLARVNTRKNVRIKGQVSPEVQWDIEAGLKPALSNPGILVGSLLRGRVNVEVSGTITVSKLFYKRTIPVTLKTPVQIPVH